MEHLKAINTLVIRSLLGASALLLLGCVSPQLSVITTPPGVDVYAKALDREEPRHLGKTPLRVPLYKVERHFNGSGPVYIHLEKDGFRREKLLISEISRVQIDLAVQMIETHKVQDERDLDRLISSVLAIQGQIKDKRYDDALTELKRLEQIAPNLSVLYEMQGAVYYLQKKYGEALQAYRLAVRYNPDNSEANKMRRYLESGAQQ